jgi:hypothetical protein
MNTKEPHSHRLARGAKTPSRNDSRWFFAFALGIFFVLSSKAQSELQEPAVKLLDAGSQPRKALRFHVKAGDKESTVMTMKMSTGISGATFNGQAVKMPATSMPMDLSVQSVAPNGDISYTLIMGEPGVADEPGGVPGVAQAIKSALTGLKGLSMTGVISDRGIIKQAAMKIPADADPTMRQTMEQMKDSMSKLSAPFPEEAVGPGAKWEVSARITSGGVAIDQTVTYELVSASGNHWSAKTTIEQTAGKQKIENPSMGSVQMNLLKMSSKGAGTINSDLSRIVPSQANIDTHVDMQSEIVMAQTNQPMNMKMDMNIRMEGK